MKKNLAIIITSALSLTCNSATAQHTASIIGGASVYVDKPFKYEFQEQPEHYHGTISEFKRTQGYYIGYANAVKLKNELSIEVSPQLNFTQDEIKLLDSEYNMDMTNGHYIYTGKVYERTAKGFSIGCMVPVSLKKKLFDSPLSITAGVNFTADRLVYNTSYICLNDPAFEKNYQLFTQYNDTLPHGESWGRYKDAPYKSRFGVGAQIGLEYQIARFALTGSFVTTNLNQTPANAVSLGLKYNFKSKSNPK